MTIDALSGGLAFPRLSSRAVAARLTAAAPVVAMVLWVAGLRAVDPTASALGPFGTLRPSAWIALVVVNAGFMVELVGRRRRWVLTAHLVALVVMLAGVNALVRTVADNPTASIHVGFADYILRRGQTFPGFDARFSWPGAFAFAGLLTDAAGSRDASVFANWCPVVLDLLYLLPLRVLTRSLAPSVGVAWAAMWVFVLGNWIGQDYLSPQGLAYLVGLVVLAVLVRASPAIGARSRNLVTRLRGAGAEPLAIGGSAAGRQVVIVALVLMAAALVVSHQLTPYALALSTAVLAVSGRSRWRAFPALLLLGALVWLSLGAQDFWAYHLSTITGGVGAVGSTINQSLGSRTRGGELHLLVIYGRVLFSAAILGAAAVGSFLRHRRGERGWLLEALTLAPFGLVAIQSYGGEILLRAQLFSLPFAALLCASAWRHLRWQPMAKAAAAGALAVIAGATCILARYGNDPFYASNGSEVAVVDAAYRAAVPGARLAVMSQNLPWRYRDIDRVKTISFEKVCGGFPTAACIETHAPEELIVTNGQRQYALLVQRVGQPAWDDLVASLPALGYREVWRNAGGALYVRKGVSVPLDLGPEPTGGSDVVAP